MKDVAKGALYGTIAAAVPRAAAVAGLPFGAALFALADEAAVPALGLAPPPPARPIDVHARALVAHLVYGLTTDVVRRAVRRAIG